MIVSKEKGIDKSVDFTRVTTNRLISIVGRGNIMYERYFYMNAQRELSKRLRKRKKH